MKIIPAPESVSPKDVQGRIRIFLGGSIEMGVARDWQKELTDELSKKPYADKCVFFNPRRADWDNSWLQDSKKNPFRGQVLWELENQEKADIVIYYFCAGTVSPITLLELGLFHDKNPIVCVEKGYERLGNVEITCETLGIEFNTEWSDFIASIDKRMAQLV